ncbi:MAG TPA: transglutaminase domain-containing protein [Jatrophihabitantaceae bacterium]
MRDVVGRRRESGRARRGRTPERPAVELAGRVPVLGAIAACVLAGSLFGPVFGSSFPPAVMVPVLAVGAIAYAGYEAVRARPGLEPWRPALTLLAGLLVIVEITLHDTTSGGLPTSTSLRALGDAARRSWLLTLQSTLPARPEAHLVGFVPLLVLAAAVISVQVLMRTQSQLGALVPGLVVAGLAQAFHPLSATSAVLAVLVYAVPATAVLGTPTRLTVRLAALTLAVGLPALLLGTVTGTSVDPAKHPAYSLRDQAAPAPVPTAVVNPLDEIAYRLEHPDVPLFHVSGLQASVDRWPLAVFDHFDGSNWTSTSRFRYLGARIDTAPGLTGPTQPNRAAVALSDLPGPWLPSQHNLNQVDGVDAVVDEASGTLLTDAARPDTNYELRWSSPTISATALAKAALAPHAIEAERNPGPVPPTVLTVARDAVGDAQPSFQAALLLERYLREHYRVAIGSDLPAGHGWPQIVQFLTPGQHGAGTSEQFAAAYVVLARAVGIPARLVVGYRQPSELQPDGSYLIRNRDVLAWPEVAVRGMGWIPLDPSGARQQGTSGGDPTSLAAATAQARDTLPPPNASPPPPDTDAAAAPAAPHSAGGVDSSRWAVVAGLVLLAALLGWLLGVPLAKGLRGRARRRRTGPAAVVAAWLEARDRLRDHGVRASADMTARDLVRSGRDIVDPVGQDALAKLVIIVDTAMWSGAPPPGGTAEFAWYASDTVRQGLARRSLVARFIAAVDPRGLRPVR